MSSKWVRFFLYNYYPLYYHQELVATYRIHYDRYQFRRIYENVSRYCLFQYRKLFPFKQHSKRYRNYPLVIDNVPTILLIHKYFFLFMVIRCASIICIKSATDTETKRIWLGTEFFKRERLFIEPTFLFCSIIGVLYMHYSLTNSLLDYKFLAVLWISPKRPEYLRHWHLGNDGGDFENKPNLNIELNLTRSDRAPTIALLPVSSGCFHLSSLFDDFDSLIWRGEHHCSPSTNITLFDAYRD